MFSAKVFVTGIVSSMFTSGIWGIVFFDRVLEIPFVFATVIGGVLILISLLGWIFDEWD